MIKSLNILIMVAFMMPLTGCELRKRMYDQPKYEPMEHSDFFGDGRSARNLVEGTVPRGHLKEDEVLYKGTQDGEQITEIPVTVTRELLERGQERFDIYCSVCHGLSGYGNGMVVQRGYKQPTSFHDPEFLSRSTPGYIYHVLVNGFGQMQGYADQVTDVHDRWAIVAYVKTLQLSQNVPAEDLPADVKQELNTH